MFFKIILDFFDTINWNTLFIWFFPSILFIYVVTLFSVLFLKHIIIYFLIDKRPVLDSLLKNFFSRLGFNNNSKIRSFILGIIHIFINTLLFLFLLKIFIVLGFFCLLLYLFFFQFKYFKSLFKKWFSLLLIIFFIQFFGFIVSFNFIIIHSFIKYYVHSCDFFFKVDQTLYKEKWSVFLFLIILSNFIKKSVLKYYLLNTLEIFIIIDRIYGMAFIVSYLKKTILFFKNNILPYWFNVIKICLYILFTICYFLFFIFYFFIFFTNFFL